MAKCCLWSSQQVSEHYTYYTNSVFQDVIHTSMNNGAIHTYEEMKESHLLCSNTVQYLLKIAKVDE